jgi:hypothetical protein
MLAARDDGKPQRSAWAAYKRRLAALAQRGGEAVSPLPVTVSKLRAVAAEYVLVEGLKPTSLAALATNLRQYVTTAYGASKWRLGNDDWVQWHTARRMLEKEAPAELRQAQPIRAGVMHRLVPYLQRRANRSLVALQSAAMYAFMYQCMLRAVDVTRANLWAEDVTFVPAKPGFHSGGVQLLVVLDKNRKRTLAGSMTFACNTDDGLALLPLLER